VFDIPFNSANKWSLAVTSCPGDSNHQLVMMKGAPEIILTKCSHHLHNKQEKEIDEVRGLETEAASNPYVVSGSGWQDHAGPAVGSESWMS
jgi:magnesium-transporting ATPase (P-type)